MLKFLLILLIVLTCILMLIYILGWAIVAWDCILDRWEQFHYTCKSCRKKVGLSDAFTE